MNQIKLVLLNKPSPRNIISITKYLFAFVLRKRNKESSDKHLKKNSKTVGPLSTLV